MEINLRTIENTVLVEIDNVPFGYVVETYRKAKIGTDDYSVFVDQAVALYERLGQLKSKQFLSVLCDTKHAVYDNRKTCKRPTSDVVHDCMELSLGQDWSIGACWRIVVEGWGHSATTGRHLKPLVCKEKIRKIAVAYVDKLREMQL